VPVAVLASLAAGLCFAVAGVLQQRAASARPDEEALSPRLLGHLVRDRIWRYGIGLAVLAYGFQSLALAFGPLSLVQPLIVAELVFAVPLSARVYGVRLGRREWFGTLSVTVGLGLALASARPHGGRPGAVELLDWLLVLGATGALVCAALVVSRLGPGPRGPREELTPEGPREDPARAPTEGIYSICPFLGRTEVASTV
jgi:drug/metabolite transporter (DMT)-like permease